MKHLLYLASGSAGRKQLLQEARIPFELAFHTADETACRLDQPLEQVVRELAVLKMAHVNLPVGQQGQIVFVLTADTLTLNSEGELLGKPQDRLHAIAMLSNRKPVLVGTAFCLEKKEYVQDSWCTLDRMVEYDQAYCSVDIPDQSIDFYLKHIPYRMVSGAFSVAGFGEQFVKEVKGSYSAIIGLPMYKFHRALQKMGYF